MTASNLSGFIVLHRSADTSLASQPWLSGVEDISACASAAELLQNLQRLNDSRAASVNAAMEEGRAAGRLAGHDEAVRTIAPQLLQMWQQASARLDAQLHELRATAAGLACMIVERIATGLAPADVVAALARRAVQDLVPAQTVTVCVHPDMVYSVRKHLSDQCQEPSDTTKLQVRGDPELSLLDCRLDLPGGQRLAGLDIQTRNAARVLATLP